MSAHMNLTFFAGYHYHAAGWRMPSAYPDLQSIETWVEVARKCEDAKFDALFVADTASASGFNQPESFPRTSRPVSLHPVPLLGALAMATTNIGLAATISTTYTEPYDVARQLSSLDLISHGRVGWNIVTSATPDDAVQFGGSYPDPAQRYARAEEYVDVLARLWENVEPDAFPRDKKSGIFTDVEKFRAIDFEGEYYQVQGPLSAEASPQGRPVLVQAGQSVPGRALASRTADLIFTAQNAYEPAHEFYTDIKAQAAAWGRDPQTVKIIPGLVAIVGESRAEAEDKAAELDSLIDPVVGLTRLNYWLHGIDLREYDLDGPFPDLPASATTSRGSNYVEMAKRENLTLRQVMQRAMASNAHFAVTGTASEVVDQMEHWFTHEAADGFNVQASTAPASLDDFIRLVLPELRRRGLFRTEYEGNTLRANLGVPLAPVPRRNGAAADINTGATKKEPA